MDKVFEELLATGYGKEVLFGVVASAITFKNATLTPHNPFVKSIGSETLTAQQAREFLFVNLTEFERVISELYTDKENIGEPTIDLTFPSK